MSKLLIDLYDFDSINDYLALNIKSFIINLQEFSTEKTLNVFLEQVEIINDLDDEIELFINLDRLYYNDDFNSLSSILKKLNKLKIRKLIINDAGVVELIKELGLKFELINGSNTLNTNYQTIEFLSNYYRGFYLSNEINLNEILKIRDNTNAMLMVQVFGKQLMFSSKRKLLTSYFQFHHLDLIDFNSQNPLIIKDLNDINNKSYIYEDSNGTYVTTYKNVNALDYLYDFIVNDIDYLYLSNLFIDRNSYLRVVNIFSSLLEQTINLDMAKSMFKDVNLEVSSSFLNDETVFNLEDIKKMEGI
ncbi:MAG: U32 family peptidase [Bacilli bacterium]|jgi:putative protease|nr:U32 family peptidase [Bacilli bacterium]